METQNAWKSYGKQELPVRHLLPFNEYFQLSQTRFATAAASLQLDKNPSGISPDRHFNIGSLDATIWQLHVITRDGNVADAIIRRNLRTNSFLSQNIAETLQYNFRRTKDR